MTVTSFRPTHENAEFLKTLNINKSEFINKAIEIYNVYLLRKELREGFSKQNQEDILLSNIDISDFISIIGEDGL